MVTFSFAAELFLWDKAANAAAAPIELFIKSRRLIDLILVSLLHVVPSQKIYWPMQVTLFWLRRPSILNFGFSVYFVAFKDKLSDFLFDADSHSLRF